MNANDNNKGQQRKSEPAGKVRSVLLELAQACPDPGRLLELYYWSAEAELLEVLHHYIGLPEQPREALRAFLAMVSDCPNSVSVNVSANGDVTLSSAEVARLMDGMDVVRSADNQTEGPH
ncbi:MAG TPA: hypothetical protein VE224_20295 [Pseudolabrys sp.]|nr:hypothetical protein [Pseudolabrys sp.]